MNAHLTGTVTCRDCGHTTTYYETHLDDVWDQTARHRCETELIGDEG